MRVMTRGTLKTTLATCAAMMLRLSPLVTDAKQSAFSMPARRRTDSSIPVPTTMFPPKPSPRLLKAETRLSMMVTSWPAASSSRARVEPTRPQPTMTTFTAHSPVLIYPPSAFYVADARLLGVHPPTASRLADARLLDDDRPVGEHPAAIVGFTPQRILVPVSGVHTDAEAV